MWITSLYWAVWTWDHISTSFLLKPDFPGISHYHSMMPWKTAKRSLIVFLLIWVALDWNRLWAFTAPRSRLLVVLDLDETLLHASLSKDESWSWLKNPRLWQAAKIDFEAKGQGLVLGLTEEIPLYVSLRPGAKEFVSWLKSKENEIEIAVYTAGTRQYASQSVELLGLDGYPCLYRDECIPFGLPLAKDLKKFREDLSRVVLVDNSKKSFWLQPKNGLLVSDWDGTNINDQELTRVKQELLGLLDLDDVRPVLNIKSGEASPDLRLLLIIVVLIVIGAGYWLVASQF